MYHPNNIVAGGISAALVLLDVDATQLIGTPPTEWAVMAKWAVWGILTLLGTIGSRLAQPWIDLQITRLNLAKTKLEKQIKRLQGKDLD